MDNVTSQVYADMFNNSIIAYLYGMDKISDCIPMQDGARSYPTQQNFDLVAERFVKRIIGLDSEKKTVNGINWPPYPPDLNPSDFGTFVR